MEEKREEWGDLYKVIDGMWFKPPEVRALAVLAELVEESLPKRRATQAEVAQRYGASERMLRYWVSVYKKHGVAGLFDKGGQGAKPRYPPEEVRRIFQKCLEETGAPPGDGGGGGGGGGGPCEACEEAKEGKKAKRPPPKPEPCPCRGRCATLRSRGGGCACGVGKACKCRCCRSTRLRPKGPRHAPGCPGRRISPKNGTSIARFMAAMEEELGGCYCVRHTRRIAGGMSMSTRCITRQHTNHAPRAKVSRWQCRLKPSLERYKEAGWAIYVHDEAYVVHDRKNGTAWGPVGERTTLPRSGSGQRATVQALISTKKGVVMGEYARADSFSFLDHVEDLLQRDDKVLVITDNMSSHNSKDTRNGLRRLRRKYPGKKIRIRRLPVGSPYLSVVEALWNRLKAILLARYHYPTFDDVRWEIDDFAKNNTTIDLDAMEYLTRDPAIYAIA